MPPVTHKCSNTQRYFYTEDWQAKKKKRKKKFCTEKILYHNWLTRRYPLVQKQQTNKNKNKKTTAAKSKINTFEEKYCTSTKAVL